MTTDDFFEEADERSKVKAQIVSKYFWSWSKVMRSTQKRYPNRDQRIAYIDLFSGPGRYEDGTPSTPLLVLERALRDPDLCSSLVMKFNDKRMMIADKLRQEIAELPAIGDMRYRPEVFSEEIDEQIEKIIEATRMVPTLCFLDPFGYKGISKRLVRAILKDWGSECIFFFGFNSVNRSIDIPLVDQHMARLFGEDVIELLRGKIAELHGDEREFAILETMCHSLRDAGGTFVLPFCFKDEHGTRTSHHLIFVSKHVLGYTIMKEIMAKHSSTPEQGVPSFVYNPATERQPLLFELTRPLDDLKQLILSEFAGRQMTVEEIYKCHHVGRRFVKQNYLSAVRELVVNERAFLIGATNPKMLKYGDVVQIKGHSKE